MVKCYVMDGEGVLEKADSCACPVAFLVNERTEDGVFLLSAFRENGLRDLERQRLEGECRVDAQAHFFKE